MKILVVDDERDLADSIVTLLRTYQYDAEAAYDGDTGLQLAGGGSYDLIILDIMLPQVDGFEILCSLRGMGHTVPILLLTAKGDLDCRVYGLEHGADYYLPKPFSSRELMACVKALLRRQGVLDNKLTYGNTTLELSTSILSTEEDAIRLSSKEYELMKAFLMTKHRNISKESLIIKAWGYDTKATENYVEVYVSLLRKKLSAIGSNIAICAILRQGYHLEVRENDSKATR